MLESVLADILTRVLGQYLQGIDRQSVQFGAWSGLIELHHVALRPDALAVLFETLGLALPVTVESGYIGLLRLIVPWKSIGTSPVQIYMHDVTIVARPVTGDDSHDSHLALRHRRIKRAKLNTDDAVRDASWNVSTESNHSNKSSWSSWLVGDHLRTTILNNIQVHLSDIIIRFEDPFSNPSAPYLVSLQWQSIDIISANAKWQEAFVEDPNQKVTRKLLQIKGFRVHWAPLFPSSSHTPSSTSASTSQQHHNNLSLSTPQLLKQYVTASYESDTSNHKNPNASQPQSLVHRVDGSVRLRLSSDKTTIHDVDFRVQQPSAYLDIIFPQVTIDINDTQYTSLMQTSLYFARIATRGFRPATAKARWKWAVDQLLPGCSTRFKHALRFSPDGLKETRAIRDSYIAYRTSLLKARRTSVDEPKEINEKLEEMEDSLNFDEIIAYRDAVDALIEKDGHLWIPENTDKQNSTPATGNDPAHSESKGTTMSSFWTMLGYKDSPASAEKPGLQNVAKDSDSVVVDSSNSPTPTPSTPTSPADERARSTTTLALRAAFLLREATIRMSEGGYPVSPVARVELKLSNFRVGMLYSSAKDMIVEAVLGSIEAWDVRNNSRMVYSRSSFANQPISSEGVLSEQIENLYPRDVSKAIESIRNGINPAKELLEHEEIEAQEDEFLDDSEDKLDSELSIDISNEDDTSHGKGRAMKDKKHIPDSSSSRPKYRITDDEFFGTSTRPDNEEYVAALRYSKLNDKESNSQTSSLDASVATLEALVDGPTGSFVWGLKFWQPKGLIQDPIMSFLGAAAGARIAQLRIELGQALLSESVPLQVNAVILAPRFIIPSSNANAPVIVVNMGTLGICTSDSSHHMHGHQEESEHKHLRYSSYVLTLDNLGMYFSPNLSAAVSQHPLIASVRTGSEADRVKSTTGVERIIRPLSLRFIFQTLRDSKVAQVAHGVSSAEDSSEEEGIAKVRLRGKIPQLSFLLTQKSFQHILATARSWSDEIKTIRIQQTNEAERTAADTRGADINVLGNNTSSADTQQAPTLAAYSVKVNVQTMSLELREDMDVKLVTATASDLSSNIIKRGQSSLKADVSLRSWSVTDGSRGSTAAFRHLLHSGTMFHTDGVSPPRTVPMQTFDNSQNFVSIRYSVDLKTQEQNLYLHFLSLHMNCVRETYIRLLSFFDGVRKYVNEQRLQSLSKSKNTLRGSALENDGMLGLQALPSIASSGEPDDKKDDDSPDLASVGKMTVVSEFDGFTFQLVSSEGVVATFEMKNSNINFKRDVSSGKKAWGNFGSVLVQDLTASLREHVSILDYDGRSGDSTNPNGQDTDGKSDGWELLFPMNATESYRMNASFKGIHMLYLQRFSNVIKSYLSVLVNYARPAMSSIIEDTKNEFSQTDRQLASKTVSSLSSRFFVSLNLKKLSLRIPRHSTCLSEAVIFKIGQVHVDNISEGSNLIWNTHFERMQGAAQYEILAHPNQVGDERIPVTSTFMEECTTEMVIQPSEDRTGEDDVGPGYKIASMEFTGPLRLNISEAQYTVLYFAVNENFTESIPSDVKSSLTGVPEQSKASAVEQTAKLDDESSKDGTIDIDRDMSNIYPDNSVKSTVTVQLQVKLPVLAVEVSRGWDVNEPSCKVLGIYLTNIALGVTISSPMRKFVEAGGTLHSVTDLRPESLPLKRNMVVHLSSSVEEKVLQENITMTYDKLGTDRPSIVVALEKLQFEMVPELLRDLGCLAIPGWPFLKTSEYGPDIQYVGRTLNLEMNNSQVLLLCESSVSDRRALVLTGKFELKMDFKRHTAAKALVLHSKDLEVFTVNKVMEVKETGIEFGYGLKDVCAEPFEKSHSPLIYPTDLMVEFVGPNVDEDGRRIHISIDAALIMLCTSEIPVLRAVMKRLGSVAPSYLSQREWAQTALPPGQSKTALDPKEERKLQARDNLNFSMTIPVSRYVITDDRDGRFVPIIECRLSSLSVEANGSSMVQVEGELSMDLFNPKKGCWEPSVEPWKVSASMSRGQSGARAIVFRSDERLNLNVAPTTITAAKTVASALQSATAKGIQQDDSSQLSQQSSFREEVTDSVDARRPSVAVFMVRNELGIAISMRLPGKSKWTLISHDSEIEVGAQSEALISSTNGQATKSRDKALRCSISIPSYAPQDLSASEAGKHSVRFYPSTDSQSSQPDLSKLNVDVLPIELLWDVELVNGVPMCIVRSPFKIINNTKMKLDVIRLLPGEEIQQDSSRQKITLEASESLSVPLHDLNKEVRIRPVVPSTISSKHGVPNEMRPFKWSAPFPPLRTLITTAYQRASLLNAANSNTRRNPISLPLVDCKPKQSSGQSYVFKLIPTTSKSSNISSDSTWLDVSISAPLILTNMLPGPLSYQVFFKERGPSSSSSSLLDADGTIITTGVVKALDSAHLHFSDENIISKILATAFDNGALSYSNQDSDAMIPRDFGPGVPLANVISGKTKNIFPSPVQSEDLHGQTRKHFRANVQVQKGDVPNLTVHAGFWVRNRSDTPIEICSRQSFYSSGTIAFYLRERPPDIEPDDYVCCEGPYISIRLPSNRDNGFEVSKTNWWTCPSALGDMNKPIPVSISGRSLELEVRPSLGVEGGTYIVTIRNASWIINSTSSPLQWCQQSSLDAHGNCPTRLLKSMRPGDVQGLHWNSKSSVQAIHLRLADDDGRSDWIWSPAVPLDIGHSRELPAKMYRPRTHDQYIARVASKEIAGNSVALVIYEEDRQNPPYRIINMCKERAIAFSQAGSQERPWLVRAGKSSRYSWDDPLASPLQRELSVRIIEKEDLVAKSTTDGTQRSRTWRAPSSALNIDKVGDRVMVLGDPFDPPVVFNVTVDGATKVITLFDEGSEEEILKSNGTPTTTDARIEDGLRPPLSKESSVPILGWDDISADIPESKTTSKLPHSDYARNPQKKKNTKQQVVSSGTDAAVFLDSIGVSMIDGAPEELLYFSLSGILLNYEASEIEQNVMLTIERFQIDNQMTKTPYPVLLWVKPVDSRQLEPTAELQATSQNAIVVELRRDFTKDDILMVKSFQAHVRQFSISFEEELISRLLKFSEVSSTGEKLKQFENLHGSDEEGARFTMLMPGTTDGSIREHGNASTSGRIYVHNFKIGTSAIRLTSTGSGSAIGKAAGLNASARALVGLLLNVENCNFEFPALVVNNVFDSLHHFGVLVRTYYVQQLDNQRLKLLTSNSLVGNPAALFDAVGTGARDFLSEPGRAKGSADFFASVGRGSKSLFTHTVGGFVESVSSIPRAVSSGLERAVGDNDYIAERERIRGSTLASGQRGQSKNPAQGLATGALSLAHGISSGVTGFIREPVQGAKQGGAGGLLKGIGKAFIGGVAKPVAGAMDLVAEPAAGLSRQIVDAEDSPNSAIPDRPPRAFRGKSQRIETFDRSYSIGVWLLKAVCLYSGMPVRSNLVSWVELSNRQGRRSEDADLWMWYIVQRFSRCMPGTKKQIRQLLRQRAQGKEIETSFESRPEKTRVALLTSEDIVVATLDCKLVGTVPFWDDAEYEVIADGKEVIIKATVLRSDKNSMPDQNSASLLTEAHSLIHAPWDAANSVKRRKPSPGESSIDRIICGSTEARDDLGALLRKLLKEKEDVRKKQQRRDMEGSDPMVSGEELLSKSQWKHGGEEMSTPRKRDNWPMPTFGTRGAESGDEVTKRKRGRLQRSVEELCKDGRRLNRRQGAEVSMRIIVANEVGSDDMQLRLKQGTLEHGQWTREAPLTVKDLEACVMEMRALPDDDEGAVGGKVLFDIFAEEDGQGKEVGQVGIEFSRTKDSVGSFTTKSSTGFSVTYDDGLSTPVFWVRRSLSEESQGDGLADGNGAEKSSDEKLLQQLMDLGFKLEDAVAALADSGGDLVKAVDLLMSSNGP